MRIETSLQRRSLLKAQLISLALAGCASFQNGPAPNTPWFADRSVDLEDRQLRGSRSVLTRPELDDPNLTTILDALRRLRPEFLRPSLRPPSFGRSELAVYVNNVYDGGLSQLESIPLGDVREIRFMTAMEAAGRFGQLCRCEGGALLIKTRSAQR